MDCGGSGCATAFIICPTAPLDASYDSDCTIICPDGESCELVTIQNANGGKMTNFHLDCDAHLACYYIQIELDLVSIETVEILAVGSV